MALLGDIGAQVFNRIALARNTNGNRNNGSEGDSQSLTQPQSIDPADRVPRHQLFSREELIDKFGWEDYLVLSIMLMASILIGVYFWWKGQDSNYEFLMGGRNLGTVPITLSLIARLVSGKFQPTLT